MMILGIPLGLLIIVGLGIAIAAAVVDKLVPDVIESAVAGAAGGGSDVGTAAVAGSPKHIIDTQVIPLAAKNKMKTGNTVAANDAANAGRRGGRTTSGGQSDHGGPPNERWAVDTSNGSSPTPEMDQLARDLAKAFGLKWNGSGMANETKGGMRIQMIYRSMIGGNHFNHVHFGVRKA